MNVLPLIANLDRLFDEYLIALEPDIGDMLVSDTLSNKDRRYLACPHLVVLPSSSSDRPRCMFRPARLRVATRVHETAMGSVSIYVLTLDAGPGILSTSTYQFERQFSALATRHCFCPLFLVANRSHRPQTFDLCGDRL